MIAAATLVVAFLGVATLAFTYGYGAGRRAERKRARDLTSFAAWVFRQLWIAPEDEWHVLQLRRTRRRYWALFDENAEPFRLGSTHTNYLHENLPDTTQEHA